MSSKPAHDAKEDFHLAPGQRGRGLVENEYPAIPRQSLADFDQLLMRDREIAHQNAGIDVAELREHLPRPAVQFLVVQQECATGAGRGHEDVLGHRDMGAESGLLMHEPDAKLLRHGRR